MNLLTEYLDKAKNPCLLLSGGRDSVLLLSKIRAIRGDIDCICFATDFTADQWAIIQRLIKEWGIEVYTLPSRHSYIVPNGDHLARVDEYGLGEVIFPVLRDLVHDDCRCLLDLSERRLAAMPFPYDVAFTGTRKTDRSAATGFAFKRPVVEAGGITFVAPLWDYADAQVMAEAKHLPVSKEFYELGDIRFDSGNFVSCSRCFDTEREQVFCPKVNQQIFTVNWRPTEMLVAFQQKFEINEESVWEH